MKEQCFDAETIQAFLDGELSSDLLENVACHMTLCDKCALLLSEAEEESAFAFSLLDEELNALVPTERIRAGVYQAISQIEQPKDSIWQKVLSFVSFLSNPSVAAFASLLIVAGIFAFVLSYNNPNSNENSLQVATNPTQNVSQTSEITLSPTPDNLEKVQSQPKNESQRISFKPEPVVKSKLVKTNDEKQRVKNSMKVESIEGEATYLKTIVTLEHTIKDKKDNILRASSRVSFERDMAVVDDSIRRMKAEVKKNPKNEAAKQILRNSYQNKIELLNSVTERSEFMASLD